ncbi:MAG: hypothetical protein RIS47_249 [Bacteroidota bacterium]|jgi:hypothetical protein
MQKNSVFADTMMTGFVNGAVMVSYNLILYVLGFTFNKFAGFVAYPLMIGLLTWGMFYRRTQLGGYITYGQSLITGVMISVYGGMIVTLYTVVLFFFIDPQLFEQFFKVQEAELLKNPQMTDEMVDQAISMMRKFMSKESFIGISLVSSAIFGLILSAIISIFVKKNDPNVIAY